MMASETGHLFNFVQPYLSSQIQTRDRQTYPKHGKCQLLSKISLVLAATLPLTPSKHQTTFKK